MDLKIDSYFNCLVHLKENHGYTVDDLSNLLGISKEVIRFFIDPKRSRNLFLLNAILEKKVFYKPQLGVL